MYIVGDFLLSGTKGRTFTNVQKFSLSLVPTYEISLFSKEYHEIISWKD